MDTQHLSKPNCALYLWLVEQGIKTPKYRFIEKNNRTVVQSDNPHPIAVVTKATSFQDEVGYECVVTPCHLINSAYCCRLVRGDVTLLLYDSQSDSFEVTPLSTDQFAPLICHIGEKETAYAFVFKGDCCIEFGFNSTSPKSSGSRRYMGGSCMVGATP